jgi:hypothetical protein
VLQDTEALQETEGESLAGLFVPVDEACVLLLMIRSYPDLSMSMSGKILKFIC